MPAFTSSTLSRYTGKWLIGTGIFELALAALFVVLGLADAELTFGFLLTAAILGATGLGLVWFGLRARRAAAEADRIASTGIAGTATVTSLTQTGMSLNDQPQVEIHLLVSIPGREPYEATRKEFVPLVLLGRLSSGLPLPVKVDRADPQAVIIDWAAGTLPGVMGARTGREAAPGSGAGMGADAGPGSAAGLGAAADPGAGVDSYAAAVGSYATGIGSPAGQTETLAEVQAALAASGIAAAAPFATRDQGTYNVDQLRASVRATGIGGTAVINELTDTGQIVGDERLFTMEVTIHLAGEADRRLPPSAAMVPIGVADRVAVGKTIPVKVARDNPNLVVFEWESLEPGGPSAIL